MGSRLLIALLLLALASGCGTARVVRLDTGPGAPREYRPPTSHKAVEVDEDEFKQALTRLVLEVPLTLRTSQPGQVRLASYPTHGAESRWGRLMSKSLMGLCEPGQRRADCLSVLDEVMGLSEEEKLLAALGLSLDPLRESIREVVEDTLAPQLVYGMIATGLVSWVMLAANPEPVFTKSAALVSAVMLLYLGVDAFLTVVEASLELKRTTDRATTPRELQEASQRFGHKVGPQLARVFVLAVTAGVSHGTVGGAAWLASRAAMLPRFTEALALGGSQVGVSLAQVGQVSAVAVIGGTVVISLPTTALAMSAQGPAGGSPGGGSSPGGFRSWGSFSGLKNALGSAGQGKQWHHLVEQTNRNVQRFGPHALHNTENVIALDAALHTRVSAFYSRKNALLTGSKTLTVRQWLGTQSYEAQRRFGLLAIQNVQLGVW